MLIRLGESPDSWLNLLGAGVRGPCPEPPAGYEGWLDELPLAPLPAAAGVRVDSLVEPGGTVRLRARWPGAGATSLGLIFEAQPQESFFGFGERSDRSRRRDGWVESRVGEGPYQLEEYPLVGALVPAWGMSRRRDATYYPIPWLLSSRGYGAWVANNETAFHRFDPDLRVWSVEVAAAEIELVLFPGPTPAGALRRFTERCGRQPVPEAAWFLGPWFQTGHANHPDPALEREMLETLLAADAPVSAAETHLRYLPCGEHAGHREAERERAAYFHGHGLAILSYLNPMLCLEYQPVFDAAARAAVLLRGPGGEPYRFWAYVGGREVPGAELAQFDFSAPGALEFFGRLVDELVEDGHDGWMEDFGEYTPPDAIAASGLEGSALHNQYPAAYHRALAQCAARHPRPLARFCRSGWSGSAADTPIVWGGDPTTGWGFDGLASAVIQGLSCGLSGIAIWGSDIGGFFTLSGEELTPELLIRWIQFGALSPVMRTKAGGVSIPPRPRPQIVDPEVLPHWRRWAKLHTQLNPYLMEAASEYAASGLPLMRHLALLEPWDPIAAGLEDQYLLGSDLLVAPVLSPGQRTRRLYLPAGRWCDLWRSAAYLESTGGLEPGRAVMLEGPGWVELPAPLEEIPVLVRAEARIPMLEPAIRSLYLAEALPLPGLLQIPNRPGEHLLWLRSGSAPEGPAARR